MKTKRSAFGDQRGMTLVVTLLVVFTLLSLTVASLLATTSDLKISSNYQTAMQAVLTAQAGIEHAKEAVNELGVTNNFQTEIVANWSSVFGTGTRTVVGYPLLSYSVAAVADPVDPANFMVLRSTGQAPNESLRFVEARVKINTVFSPGAIYLPTDTVDPNFNGNRFLVDGHDTNLDGTLHPAGDVPGITTHSQAGADAVINELSTGQNDNVVGLGGTPSVKMANGFTTSQLLDQMVPGILGSPGVVTDPNINGNDTFGTCNSSTSAPQITHFTGNVNITGTMDGCGILIVDNSLTISGDTTFKGLIIVKGTTEIGKNPSDTTVQGNTTILGAIWTTDLLLTVGGSASVTYSTQALELANTKVPGGVAKRRTTLVAWKDY
jgi:hypothetical protein